jgi:hypothetical protein
MTAAQARSLSAQHVHTGNLKTVHEAIEAAAKVGLYDMTIRTIAAPAVRILRAHGFVVHMIHDGWFVSWEPHH